MILVNENCTKVMHHDMLNKVSFCRWPVLQNILIEASVSVSISKPLSATKQRIFGYNIVIL